MKGTINSTNRENNPSNTADFTEALPASARLLLAVMAAALFISVFNQTMVNVAVPSVQSTFGVSESQVAWVATGYLLVFAVGVPLYGRISDFYSPRLTFFAGLVIFAVGTLVCALAPSLWMLVAGRVVQAAGGAAIPALAFGLVARLLPPGKRGLGLGVLSSSIGAGAAFGPVLGGALIQLSGWPLLFYGTLALILILVPFALYALPHTVSEASGNGRSLARLDLPSGILLALAAGFLLFGVTQGQSVALPPAVALGSFAIAAASGVAFARRITRVPDPFVKPGLFGNRGFVAAAYIGFLAMFSNIYAYFLTPIMLSQVAGVSALTIGLVFVPGATLAAVLSPVAGRLSDRLGSRVMILTGLCLMLLSHLFMSSFAAGGSVALVTIGITILGLGFAALNAATANAASATLSPAETGAGLGLYQLCVYLGAGFAPAVSGAFLAFRVSTGGEALNPLYSLQSAASFSDAFLIGAAAVMCAAVGLVGLAEVKERPAAEKASSSSRS